MNILGTDAWKSAWTLNKNWLWVEYYYCCYCPSKDTPSHHHLLTHLAAHLSLIHPSFSYPSIHQPPLHSFIHEALPLAKYLPAYSSFHEPVHPSSTHLPTHPSIIYLSIHPPPTHPSIHHLSVHPPTYPPIHQSSIHPSTHPPVIYPSIDLSIHPSSFSPIPTFPHTVTSTCH